MQDSVNNESMSLTSSALTVMIVATCLLLGNIYYAQPILFEIASSLGIGMDDSGLIVAFGQIGYISGLLFLAPLGDTFDNRKLCVLMSLGAGAFAAIASLGNIAFIFYVSIFFMGVFATATQILVVFATSLSGPKRSGRTLGIMACGLFLGIALSRPISSFLTGILGWRYVYALSSITLFMLAFFLYIFLPRQCGKNSETIPYFKIIAGMLSLAFQTRHFISYTVLSFCAFLAFTMFWSSAPLYLSESMKCDQSVITIFTMTGLITPPLMLLLGWLLDRGEGQKILVLALCLISLAWVMAWRAPENLCLFFIAALLIDPSSSATTVTVQKTLLSNVAIEKRGRVNSLNISINFLGGTIGAAAGPWLLGKYSWHYVVSAGLVIVAGLLIFTIVKQLSSRSSHNG